MPGCAMPLMPRLTSFYLEVSEEKRGRGSQVADTGKPNAVGRRVFMRSTTAEDLGTEAVRRLYVEDFPEALSHCGFLFQNNLPGHGISGGDVSGAVCCSEDLRLGCPMGRDAFGS